MDPGGTSCRSLLVPVDFCLGYGDDFVNLPNNLTDRLLGSTRLSLSLSHPLENYDISGDLRF
jgi:hypothetical protein